MQNPTPELITRSGITSRYSIGLSSIYLLQRIHAETFPQVRGQIGRAPAFDHAELVAFLEQHIAHSAHYALVNT